MFARRYFRLVVRNFSRHTDEIKSDYDVVVVGGGHNGLVAAGYLSRNGSRVCVLERRRVIGGAAVTEEIVPGFKFSRASYVLSLLRPYIHHDLELENHGLRVFLRNPSSYTPLLEKYWSNSEARSLTLGPNSELNATQIKQFSKRDAEKYAEFERHLQLIVDHLNPLLDTSADSVRKFLKAQSIWQKIQTVYQNPDIVRAGVGLARLGPNIPNAWELVTAPINRTLDKWFESEPLKAVLATDAVIGAMVGPSSPGSGYVLLHHVMGELNGIKGAWGYPEGGMGAVTEALARSAASTGADIFLNTEVKEIIVSTDGEAKGVVCKNGQEVKAKLVLSNATPDVTFLNLLPKYTLPTEVERALRQIDYTSPVTKINVALSRLPDFVANPCKVTGNPEPYHQTTIHLNCEHTNLLDSAFKHCSVEGIPSKRPMVEMVLPSVLDKTLAPQGAHVCLLFTQYTPYGPPGFWTEDAKEGYANRVFDIVEEYAPGFKDSIVGKEVLTPPDLERIFGLTGGNIFHGSMSLDQLFLARPASQQELLVPRLLLCGAGSHPGGGVMGTPGYLAAKEAIRILKKN